jgi:hypothetical protein
VTATSAAKAPARKAPRRRAEPKPRITPEQALANTRELLAAKQERDHQPPAWQQFEGDQGHSGHAGAMSDSAAEKARELHAAEIRLEGNQGHISSQDRRNQGKRDAR